MTEFLERSICQKINQINRKLSNSLASGFGFKEEIMYIYYQFYKIKIIPVKNNLLCESSFGRTYLCLMKFFFASSAKGNCSTSELKVKYQSWEDQQQRSKFYKYRITILAITILLLCLKCFLFLSAFFLWDMKKDKRCYFWGFWSFVKPQCTIPLFIDWKSEKRQVNGTDHYKTCCSLSYTKIIPTRKEVSIKMIKET